MPGEYFYDMLAFAITMVTGALIVIFSHIWGNFATMILSLVMLGNGIVMGLIIMRSINRKDEK